MLDIPGYTSAQRYRAERDTVFYRSRRVVDDRPVIIKTVAGEFPTLRSTLRLRNEYEIARGLSEIEGVVQPLSLEKFGNGLALVLDDFGGVTLDEAAQSASRDLNFFFRVAIAGAATLAAIHRRSVIHKDLRPETILLHPLTGELRITNFGIASRIPRENQVVANPESLEGDLAYISPEQTGRMNRSIDFRSDFYSLGIVLYEMLSGRRPFVGDDPLELVHCHIAQRPPHPADAGVPDAIAGILLKLLAKTPEERYQSAAGLLADLERCARKLEVAGRLDRFDFTPGENDVPAMFQIPQKLYGRENEIRRLLGAFDHTADDGVPRILFVSGTSGIGKSALVREIHRPLLQRRGYFVGGKFDQTRRDVPCWAIVQALQEFVRLILTERAERILQWKDEISGALGANGQVLVELIPELELIIGPQAEVEKLPPIESQNRFNTVFRTFIRVLSRPQRPLAIFLDDLQWADLASFELIKLLMTDLEIRGLFIIGAYRDNEVDASHPLTLTRQEIERARVESEDIKLGPLSRGTIAELLTDALYCDREETLPLAEMVAAKTDGNPFFVGEFLRSLYAEDLISLDESGRRWRWSLLRIRELDITENVVDFMTRRIRKLDEGGREILKLCACLGNRFDMRTLALVADHSISRTAALLDLSLREGLILAVDETYKYLLGYDDNETYSNQQDLRVVCKFSHDRVQQAAYSLLDDAERERTHYQIGKRLLSESDRVDEALVDIVSHLNAGRGLIAGEERRELAELNLRAGLRARDSTAYDAALRNFRIGIELLSEDAWQHHYELIFALHESLLEAAYLTGDEDLMDRTEALLKARARNVTDLVKTYEVRMTYFTGKNQSMDAVNSGLDFLRLLGVRLPARPREWLVYWNFLRTRVSQGRRRISELSDLEMCTDPKIQAIHRMSIMIAPPAIVVGSNWLYLTSMLTVRTSIAFGNSYDSPFSYAIFGLNLCGRIQDFKRGFSFGEVGVRLAERSGNKSLLAKTFAAHYYFVWHHRRHIRGGIDRLLEGYKFALESGNFEFVGWNTFFYAFASLLSGRDLSEMQEIFQRFITVQQKHRHTSAQNFMAPGLQFVTNLLGESDDARVLEGAAFSEQKEFADLIDEHPSGAFHASVLKNILCYLFEDYKEGHAASTITESLLDSVRAMPLEPLHYFYRALTAYAYSAHASPYLRWRLRRVARQCSNRIAHYAEHCPENYLHKKLLLDAEKSRLSGNFEGTIALYEQAAHQAHAQDFIHEAALIAERAGSFCLEEQVTGLARSYIQQAIYDYERWGALAKIRHLREKYGDFPGSESGAESSPFGAPTTSTLHETSAGPAQSVDLQKLVELSQVISGEIVLSELIKKMLVLAAENSGATRACLILHHADEERWILRGAYDRLLLEANQPGTQSVDNERFTLWEDRPLPDEEDGDAQILAVSAVRHSIRTRQPLALDNAVRSVEFHRDPYIQRHQVPALLCLPLVNQGEIAGVLYLENSEAEDTFSGDRTRLIELLSTQMAISIENAVSYENRRRVAELIELNRLKSELFANISHEFRTPLTLILSPIQDLLETNEEQKDLLRMIQRSAHSMLRLVNNLLDLARAEAGGLQLNKKVVDMSAFLSEIVSLFRESSERLGVLLRSEGFETPLFARIDPILLERVLLNLIGNALKYTERGEITVRLTRSNAGRFQITVSDTGSGIPDAILGSVFRRFFSAEEAARSWVPGTGIGLAFAKEMVEAHDGELTVESREGVGSDFTASLPLAMANSDADESARVGGGLVWHDANRYFREGLLIDLNDRTEGRRLATTDRDSDSHGHSHSHDECMLIVEDEPDLRNYLSSIFSNLYHVLTAETLPSAIEIVQNQRPELVLCDVMLENDQDGYGFLKAVREDPALKDTLIIMLTARDDARSRRTGLEFGADDYITKPFHTDEVVLRVRNLLSRRRRHERSLIRARETLYADLHENLDDYLDNLRSRIQTIDGQGSDAPLRERILKYINLAARSLDDSRQFGEDLNVLGDDFLEGLTVILSRRYTQSDRVFQYTADETVRRQFRGYRGKALSRIYTAIQEIATNDIKYGTGPTDWRFETDEQHLRISIKSATVYNPERFNPESGGKGASTIRSRLRELHGEYAQQVRDGFYHGRIELPREASLRTESDLRGAS